MRILHPSVTNYLLVKLKTLWACTQAKCYKDWTKGPQCIYIYVIAYCILNVVKPQPLINTEIIGKRHLRSIIHFIYLTGLLSFMYGSCLNTSMILSLSSWMPSISSSFLKTFFNLLCINFAVLSMLKIGRTTCPS